MDSFDPRLAREGVYRQIHDAALAVARNQSPDVAAHAQDIAQEVVMKFANRQMTKQVRNPAAWGATYARYECLNYANRGLARKRNETIDNDDFWEEKIDINPAIYPYKAVAGADAIAYALSCLNDREQEMVHLVEAGYSHAEVADMMGYAGARSVTTTMNRIRNKITEHLGGEDGVEELLYTSAQDMIYQLAVDDDLLLPKDSELSADGSAVNTWVEKMDPEDRKSD
jgi:RNA polymerase sigma factor (sigma-70 family)